MRQVKNELERLYIGLSTRETLNYVRMQLRYIEKSIWRVDLTLKKDIENFVQAI